MSRLSVCAFNAILIFVGSSFCSFAADSGKWTTGFGQGYLEYNLRNGPGNTFTIACDVGATPDGQPKQTSISITIRDREAPISSEIKIFADGDEFTFQTDKQGSIGTDCHVCSDAFSALWSKMRRSKLLIVSFKDGRSSPFELKGAAKVLPSKHCTTGFES